MSGISYGDGATRRSIGTVFYQDGATRRTIQNAWIGDGGTKRQVYSAYSPISSITATPNPSHAQVTQVGAGAPSAQTVSGSIALSATGGSGNYTYSTAFVSGTQMGVVNGNTANPTISVACGRNETISAVYRFMVSDGTSSAHVDVTVTRTYNWDSGA
jgi:hypothetical protein